jgi:hypothetical protein
MKIEPAALEELKRICAESFQRSLSDTEAQDIGQRIIRFLMNSEPLFRAHVPDIDTE